MRVTCILLLPPLMAMSNIFAPSPFAAQQGNQDLEFPVTESSFMVIPFSVHVSCFQLD